MAIRNEHVLTVGLAEHLGIHIEIFQPKDGKDKCKLTQEKPEF